MTESLDGSVIYGSPLLREVIAALQPQKNHPILIVGGELSWLSALRLAGLRAFAWFDAPSSDDHPREPFLLHGPIDAPLPMRFETLIVTDYEAAPSGCIKDLISNFGQVLAIAPAGDFDIWRDALAATGFRRNLDSSLEHMLGPLAGHFSRYVDEKSWLLVADEHLARRPTAETAKHLELSKRNFEAACRVGNVQRATRFANALAPRLGLSELVRASNRAEATGVAPSALSRMLRRRLDLDPSDVVAAASLSHHYLQTGNAQAALEAVEHWAGLDNDNPLALGTLAIARWRCGSNDDALLAIEAAVNLDSQAWDLRTMYCEMLGRAGRTEDALDQAKQLIKDAPADQPLSPHLIAILAASQEGDRALAAVRAPNASLQGLLRQQASVETAPETYAGWSRRHAQSLQAMGQSVVAPQALPEITAFIVGVDEKSAALDSLNAQALFGFDVIEVRDETFSKHVASIATPYCLVVRAEDRLASSAGAVLRSALHARKLDALLFDSDHEDRFGSASAPRFLGTLDRFALEHHDYVAGSAVVSTSLLRRICNDSPSDSALECIRQALLICDDEAVAHIPATLLHRRTRLNNKASSRPLCPHMSTVSVIIPTRDESARLSECLDALLDRPDDGVMEVVLIDNDSRDEAARKIITEAETDSRVTVIAHPHAFHFSRLCNIGAAQASGEILVFLNNDVVVKPGWLETLTAPLADPNVGVTGPILRHADGTIQHAGVVLCEDNRPRLRLLGSGNGSPWHGWHLGFPHEVAALTGACLAMSADTFWSVNGFDDGYRVTYGDVDLCLKIRLSGRSAVLVTDCELIHHEGISAKEASPWSETEASERREEAALFGLRWGGWCQDDIHYSPNLDRSGRGNLRSDPAQPALRFRRKAESVLITGEIGAPLQHLSSELMNAGNHGHVNLETSTFHDLDMLQAQMQRADRTILIVGDPLERLVRWTLTMATRLNFDVPTPLPGRFLPLFMSVVENLYGGVEPFWRARSAFCSHLEALMGQRVLLLRARDAEENTTPWQSAALLVRSLPLDAVATPENIYPSWLTTEGVDVLNHQLDGERRFCGYA